MNETGDKLLFAFFLFIAFAPVMALLLGDLGIRWRWPWRHADDCPCAPCIDKAVQREVGKLERKRRIQEVRNAMEELERERRS